MSERINYETASLKGRCAAETQETVNLHVQGVENEQDGIGSITGVQQCTSV
jgi:hypothetical protein